MRIYQGRHVNTIFHELCCDIIRVGVVKYQRDIKTFDIGLVHCELLDIGNCYVTIPERKLNFNYVKHEHDWYLSGSLKANDIESGKTIWCNIADENGNIQSNYGHLVFYQLIPEFNNKSQFDWCRESLQKNINSRQAVINYNQPRHKVDNIKDFPCTMMQQFIVNEGKLDSIVYMRSNDLIYGFCYDIIWFTYVQKRLADELKIPCGKFSHIAGSMHVYERHMEMVINVTKRNQSDIQ